MPVAEVWGLGSFEKEHKVELKGGAVHVVIGVMSRRN